LHKYSWNGQSKDKALRIAKIEDNAKKSIIFISIAEQRLISIDEEVVTLLLDKIGWKRSAIKVGPIPNLIQTYPHHDGCSEDGAMNSFSVEFSEKPCYTRLPVIFDEFGNIDADSAFLMGG